MTRARETVGRILPAALGYAAGALAIELVMMAAQTWIERRQAPVDEGQAVLHDQADEEPSG